MFLIDNDVISRLRKDKDPSEIKEWFYRLYDDEVRIASVTLFEQMRGIELAELRNPRLAAELRTWWQMFETALPADAVLWSDHRSLEIQAKLFSAPALGSFLIPNPGGAAQKFKTGGDLILASIAVAKGLPIATLNVDDFLAINEVVPLPGVFSPALDRWAVPRAVVAPTREPRMADAIPIGEILKRVLWQPPFSEAVGEAQADVLAEFQDKLREAAGLEADAEFRSQLSDTTDRAALKRYVRQVAKRMDPDLASALVTGMREALDELTNDAAEDPTTPVP